MIIQKTFKNHKPTIYLITTPIGNLDDINKRSLETLQTVDLIFCEDTRISKILLDKYKISNTLISLHMHNEQQRITQIINLVNQNKNIAIISDAGVPIISDPAGYLINQLRELEIECNITAIGAGSAYIHALICSGFNSKTNYFYGFIKNKNQLTKTKELTNLINKYSNDTVISFYESVHRIKQTILSLDEILPTNHKIVLARELTKINEEIIYGTISEINQYLDSEQFINKGEFVIVIDKLNQQKYPDLSDDQIIEMIDQEVNLNHLKLKKACETISLKTNKSKNHLYHLYISKK
ncbi:16S rRNA (cytidine(1402)-2'-O)-methyltransferase [Mycoplasma putrefaciens]|uniref:Ribosomal RNA small subunit methyltransferase I n=1 Tax=Mycoplasma putrefaciens Mput9231 TaxID=1292033 RepID=M9WHC1_9MOLU|nr:16S rRNA (cytidine(1402)-2'-O)-methyltransferase [Mycoplasma putrefaciens]AGJ90784.1 Hypothetical protein, putative tetrapyrrole methylase [Mycoplasma putrefaciens Mput9231]